MAQIVIKQNSYSAAMLVTTVALIVWFLFNLVVPAYPPRVNSSAIASQQFTSSQTDLNP